MEQEVVIAKDRLEAQLEALKERDVQVKKLKCALSPRKPVINIRDSIIYVVLNITNLKKEGPAILKAMVKSGFKRNRYCDIQLYAPDNSINYQYQNGIKLELLMDTTVCKLVQTGTRTEEVPEYKVLCS